MTHVTTTHSAPTTRQATDASRERPAIGPFWLRALAITALAVLAWLLVDRVTRAIYGPGYSVESHQVRAVLTSAGVIVLVLLYLLFEGRSWASRGIALTGRSWRPLTLGLAAALAGWAIASAVLVGTGLASVSLPVGIGGTLWQGVLLAMLVLLFEALPEELLFRGLLWSTLRERLPVWATIVTQALLFTLFGWAIGAAPSLDRLLVFVLFGLALGVLRWATDSVWGTIGFHLGAQFVAQAFSGEQWTAFTLDDPGRWYHDLAFGAVPFIVMPIIALAIGLLVRGRRRRADASH